MAATKKQVSNTKKPKDKNIAAKENAGEEGTSKEVKSVKSKPKKTEEKPCTFASRRVWPD